MSKESQKGSGSPDESGDENEDTHTDKNGLAPQDIVKNIMENREQLIIDWYEQINKEPPKIDAFLDPNNTMKNRFKGVLLYDRSRVLLKTGKQGSDYYHASYVDSYEKKDGYILAQAPFDDATETDFWRMAMKERPVLIVLLGSLLGADGTPRVKCFWPALKQERQYSRGSIRVRCTVRDQERDHDEIEFTLLGSGQRAKHGFQTKMLQNRKWTEDKDVPDNLLDFRAVMKIALARAGNDDRPDGPVLFLCPTGVHRCGTFATLDILCDRLKAEKKVGLDETVAVVRAQRYGTLAHFDHYKVLHDLIVRQAVSCGMVEQAAVIGRKRN